MSNIQDIRSLSRLSDMKFMKPFLDKKGNPCVYQHIGGDRTNLKNYRKIPVANATLRYDEWRRLDETVLQVSRNRLVGFDDLRSRGLVYNLNNPMATTVLTWEQISDAMEAGIAITPEKRTDNDTPDHSTQHLPIPVVHQDFTIGERLLLESRVRGNGLDTQSAAIATRKCMEKFESLLFGSAIPLTYGGGSIYTYLNHPDVNEILFDSAADYWDDENKTGSQIIDDVRAMKQMSRDALHYGPWMLYISGNYETILDKDYRDDETANSTLTIKERLMKLTGILDVKVVDTLPDDVVLLVQMSTDTVDLVDGMPLQTVQWSTEGGFVNNYKVLGIQVPRIKSDYNGNSGIVVLATESYKS